MVRMKLLIVMLVALVLNCVLLSSSASPLHRLSSVRRHGGTVKQLLDPIVSSPTRPPPSDVQVLPARPPPSGSTVFPSLLSPSSVGADSNFTYCDTCVALTSYIGPFVQDGTTLSVIETAAIGYCVATKAEGQCDSILDCLQLCKGIIGEFGPIIVGIIANSSLSPQQVCFDLQLCPVPTPINPVAGVPVPSNVTDMRGQKKWPSWSSTTGVGTILHLTDLHFDVQYAAGSKSNDCGFPLCCRQAYGPGTNSTNTAGLFGDFQCDSSPLLVSSLLDYLNNSLTPRPDFILYTGDDPAHDVWDQTRAKNLAAIAWVNAELLRYFPDVPVFSAVGNHEMCPVNEFAGPGKDSWLYSQLVQDWAHYLPYDPQQTLNYGGYYAALVRPGLYVVSINTNIYTSDDAYVSPNNPIDLSSQLNWFNDTMHQIAQINARAIIIGHSSPLDWYEAFSTPFNAYLDLYNATVVNLFWGHTHHNQVQLYHPSSSPVPHSVGYIGGSVTPFTDTNPGFTVYRYQRDQLLTSPYLVSDVDYYWLNLTLANAQQKADWSGVKINAQRDYQLQSLSPIAWYKLAETMRTGGAAEVYERMLTGWNKGMYSGGQGSAPERQSFACDLENDQDSASRQCRQRLGLKLDREGQVKGAVRASAPHLTDCVTGDVSHSRPSAAPQMEDKSGSSWTGVMERLQSLGHSLLKRLTREE